MADADAVDAFTEFVRDVEPRLRQSLTATLGADAGREATAEADLPGCYTRAPSREDVLGKVPEVVASFVAWLREHGEPVEGLPGDVTDVEVRVVAEMDSPGRMADADTEVLLDPDRLPLTEGHWSRIASWLEHSRADLLELLDVLAPERLEHQSEGAPHTVREAITHVAFVEYFYAAWTFDLHSRDGLREFLAWTRRMAVDRMSELAARNDERVTEAEWAGAPREEQWSARKAARRLVWHELLHVKGIHRQLERQEGINA